MSRTEPIRVVPEGQSCPLDPVEMIERFRSDGLEVEVYRSPREAAIAAAAAVAGEIRKLIGERKRALGIFAAAVSVAEFFEQLVKIPSLGWTSVIGFQLGEYLGMDENAPDSSRRFLIERLVKSVPL